MRSDPMLTITFMNVIGYPYNRTMKNYVTKETKVSDVSYWNEIYYSSTATVYSAENILDYYKVKTTKTTKYFKGESAWMNVQRYVVDAGDFGGYNIFS
jgi:hypothetical protein